ncbi:MAG: hypothetical protein GEU90_13470 [Gemmatimonas sp.]|nr:hypothetical protein [Gemmatimonas sp.]
MSDDEFGILGPPPGLLDRHHIVGVGTELDWPIEGAPTPLIAMARLFFEFGNRVAMHGGTLYLGLTYFQPTPPPTEGTSSVGLSRRVAGRR